MSFLASDVMDDSAVILNDVSKAIFTYAAQLPFVQMANRELEQLLITNGAPQQRSNSSAISVTKGTLSLTLPTDFLLPESLYERNVGDGDQSWQPMSEVPIEPAGVTQGSSLVYWCFRNNGIYFVGATQDREVLLKYDRTLAIISGNNSPEDYLATRNWLAAKTAEFCARRIGMNESIANSIRDNEGFKAEDNLIRMLVMNQQGLTYRRTRFTSKRQQAF